MEKSKHYEAFVKAYNNFDVGPLRGKQLQEFGVDDFTKKSTQDIADVIKMTDRFRKILIVGQRGCGKSTILHKVAEHLRDAYHIVFYEEETERHLNVRELDVEPVDVLLAIYLQVLESAKELPKTKSLYDKLVAGPFKSLMAFLSNVEITTEIISFKLRSERESREAIRVGLHKQMKQLQENLATACQEIQTVTGREVLVIFDGLDKLSKEVATQVFFRDSQTLIDPRVKIVYAFPLHAYYHNDFATIASCEIESIPSITFSTQDGVEIETLKESLRKVVLKRIDASLIEMAALDYLIQMSGGVLRHLIQLMQKTCFLAKREEQITRAIAEQAVNNFMWEFNRLFDFPIYTQNVIMIAQTKQRDAVSNDALTYLLHYLFVLEYQHEGMRWYNLHPVLHQLLQKLGKTNA
jgi:GTPase SAR1 family protein